MANKKQMKLDMSKEAMYRKIMPSIPVYDEDDDDFVEYALGEAALGTARVPYNIMEPIVRSKLASVMDRLGACVCERCKNDSLALALNKLPAIYSGSDRESIRGKVTLVRREYEVKVTSAVIQAVQAVMAQPRH
jgi:competence protein ComFB